MGCNNFIHLKIIWELGPLLSVEVFRRNLHPTKIPNRHIPFLRSLRYQRISFTRLALLETIASALSPLGACRAVAFAKAGLQPSTSPSSRLGSERMDSFRKMKVAYVSTYDQESFHFTNGIEGWWTSKWEFPKEGVK